MAKKLAISLDEMRDRNDLRWAHPGLKDVYYVDGRKVVNKFTNEEKPLEMRRQKRDKMYSDIEMGRPMLFEEHPEFVEHATTTTIMVPGCPEEPETECKVDVRVPNKKSRRKRPVLFYIAGGAFILGTPWLGPVEQYCYDLDCVVIAPWYRTGVDAPYPAAVNDLHAAYQYMVEHAAELNCDPNKVVITGMSAGAALSLSFAFRLKRYGYSPRGVVALDPICDERSNGFLSHTYVNDGLDDEQVKKFSKQYLGKAYGSDDLGPEAFCNHATVEDCYGLCPIVIHGAENDVDRDASNAFMQKLYAAGVYAEYHVWGGCCHATLFNASSEYEQRDRFMAVSTGNIKDFMKYDMRRQWLTEPENAEEA
jgi:acetyl esterase/lipase